MKHKKDLASLLMFYSQAKVQNSCQQQDEFVLTVWEKCQNLKVKNYYEMQRCIEKWDKCFEKIVESERPRRVPIEDFDAAVEDAVKAGKEITEIEEVMPFFKLGELASTVPGPHDGIGQKKIEAISYFWKFRCFNENAPILSILMLMDDKIGKKDLEEVIGAFKRAEESRKFEEHFSKMSYQTDMFIRWQSSMLNRYDREIKEDGRPVNDSHYIRDGQKPNEKFIESEFWAAYCFQYMMHCVQHQQSPCKIRIDCKQQWSYFSELWPYDWKIFWPSLFSDNKEMTDIWQRDTDIGSGKDLLSDSLEKYSNMKREIEETFDCDVEEEQEKALQRKLIAVLKARGIEEIADINDENVFVKQWMPPALAALNESGLRESLRSIDKYTEKMRGKESIYDTIACFRCDALLHALLNGPHKTYYQKALFILAIGREEEEEAFCRPYSFDDPEGQVKFNVLDRRDKSYRSSTEKEYWEEFEKGKAIEKLHEAYIRKLEDSTFVSPWNYNKMCNNIDRDFLIDIFAFPETLPIDDLLFNTR